MNKADRSTVPSVTNRHKVAGHPVYNEMAEMWGKGLRATAINVWLRDQGYEAINPQTLGRHGQLNWQDDRDDLLQPAPQGERQPDARRRIVRPPSGWEPGVKFDPAAGRGEIVTEPLDPTEAVDWSYIFEHFHLDPEQYEVVGPVEMRSWEGWHRETPNEATTTRWLYYYKARFALRGTLESRQAIDDLVDSIRREKPVRRLLGGNAALVVNLADWQTGKRDGDGTLGLIKRVRATVLDLKLRVAELRKMGVQIGVIYVAGVGDLIESCNQAYAMQCFTVQLNLRDQRKLARRLVKEVIREASRLAEQVVVVAVGGNHGEVRQDGKAFTTFGDNHDVAIFEEIAEALDENPAAFGHVSFVLPDESLTVTLDVAGTITTWAHGHQFKGGPGVEGKAQKWVSGQALGHQAPGDCTLLISGHYHHLHVAQWGAITWMQCPALDGGSDWWINTTGQNATPGTLSVVVGSGVSSMGWDHLKLLGVEDPSIDLEVAHD